MCVWSCGLGICFGYERGISSAIGKLRGGERAPKPSSLSCDWYLGSPMRATPNTIPRRVTTSAILNPRPRYSYCSVTPGARTTALHVHVLDAWVAVHGGIYGSDRVVKTYSALQSESQLTHLPYCMVRLLTVCIRSPFSKPLKFLRDTGLHAGLWLQLTQIIFRRYT